MNKHIELARRWFDHVNSTYGEYMEFICLYISLEILTRGKLDYTKNIVKSVKYAIQKQILDNCTDQTKYFSNNVIKNEYSNAKIKDSSEFSKILYDHKSNKADKIIALLQICFIIRGNIVHGHKNFDSINDRRITKSASVFLRCFLHFVLRYPDSIENVV